MRTQISLVNVATRKSRDAKRIRVFVSKGRTEQQQKNQQQHIECEQQAKMKRAKKEKETETVKKNRNKIIATGSANEHTIINGNKINELS